MRQPLTENEKHRGIHFLCIGSAKTLRFKIKGGELYASK